MPRHRRAHTSLRQAFGLREKEVISLVGGGGKTTLLFLLGKELAACGHRVITTTTTKLFEPGPDNTPHLSVGEAVDAVLSRMGRTNHLTVVSRRLPQGKVQGISSEEVDLFAASPVVDFMIVEADGSAQRPLKAPEAYEPVIPASTTIVVGLLGADAIDAVLDEATVFRSVIFSRLTGLPVGSRLTCRAISHAFTHRDGILRGAPSAARNILFVNKTDLDKGLQKGRAFAKAILDSENGRVERVVLGQLRFDPPVVDVILPE